MFHLFSLIAPSFLKDLIPNLMKYLKIILIACIFIAVGVFTYKAYNSITATLKEIEDNKVLIVEQKNIINQQANDLKRITEQLEMMRISHQATLDILNELSKEKEKIATVTKKRKAKLDKKIDEIDNQPIDDASKREQRSAALISDLNGTYCELFPTNCIETKEVKENE